MSGKPYYSTAVYASHYDILLCCRLRCGGHHFCCYHQRIFFAVVVIVVVVLASLYHRYIATKPVLWCQFFNSITMLLVFVHAKHYRSSSSSRLSYIGCKSPQSDDWYDNGFVSDDNGYVSERLHLLKNDIYLQEILLINPM